MEDVELKNLWKSYDQQLEQAKLLNLQSWVLNVQTKESIQLMKAKSKLNKLARFKSRVAAIGVVWVFFLLFLIYHSITYQKIFFVISASMIVLFNVFAVIVYIKHILIIHEIDNAESVVEAQEKTVKLQSSTLQIGRILFLQIPFYSTWFYTPAWIAQADWRFWLITIPITLFLALISIWLYKNIHYKNADKKWFRILFNSPEWKSVIKAMLLMKEIEEFKKESMDAG
ncbi:MAG TPA: hypothetical protein VIY47_00500 [Ignavibacteriaceae bacterium]